MDSVHRVVRGRDALLLRSDPILSSNSRHAAELAHIVGCDDQPLAAGMTANLHVVRAAGNSGTFQFRPNLPVVRSRFGLECQHIEACHKMLNGVQVVGTASRFLCAITQLAERDAGDAELLSQCVELLQEVWRIIRRISMTRSRRERRPRGSATDVCLPRNC